MKVLWQVAFSVDYKIHNIELRHSIVSGKKEVSLDGSPLYQSQQMFKGRFEHTFVIKEHTLRLTVDDSIEGFVYDLSIDGIAFHRCNRKSISEIEIMRKAKAEQSTKKSSSDESKIDEADKKEKKKKSKKEKKENDDAIAKAVEEVNLLGDVLESTTISPTSTQYSTPTFTTNNYWNAPAASPYQPAPAPFVSITAPPPAFDPYNPVSNIQTSSQMPISSANTASPFAKIDLASAYAQASTSGFNDFQQKQQQAQADPFSSDLYNLSNLNAAPGKQAPSTATTTSYRSNVPLNQMSTSQPQPVMNPFPMNTGYQQQPVIQQPMSMQQPYVQQQQQLPYGTPMYMAPVQQQQQQPAQQQFYYGSQF